ncbi:MAG: 23S rRNA (pseudouridine(1915)-N(3))-methyltransferase RlmH [Muribaculaceae bacterium]|nr:23S rRNA (pseudouridine(1915)-N(3))-methyltransferase RlmH [Muribaculaceae bacterium]
MRITLMMVGETRTDWVKLGEKEYLNRINRYIKFDTEIIPDIRTQKKIEQVVQKKLEGESIITRLLTGDRVILLDENGQEMKSREFSAYLDKFMVSGIKRLVFVIGGPYGFSDEVYKRADGKISMSKLTFPHELIRVLFLEQVYRAFTIQKNEPYHHD